MTVKECVRLNSNIFNDEYLSISIKIIGNSNDKCILSAEVNTFKNLELLFGDYEILSIFPDDSGSIIITLKK